MSGNILPVGDISKLPAESVPLERLTPDNITNHQAKPHCAQMGCLWCACKHAILQAQHDTDATAIVEIMAGVKGALRINPLLQHIYSHAEDISNGVILMQRIRQANPILVGLSQLCAEMEVNKLRVAGEPIPEGLQFASASYNQGIVRCSQLYSATLDSIGRILNENGDDHSARGWIEKALADLDDKMQGDMDAMMRRGIHPEIAEAQDIAEIRQRLEGVEAGGIEAINKDQNITEMETKALVTIKQEHGEQVGNDVLAHLKVSLPMARPNPNPLINALDRIATGEFASGVSDVERIAAMRKVASEALMAHDEQAGHQGAQSCDSLRIAALNEIAATLRAGGDSKQAIEEVQSALDALKVRMKTASDIGPEAAEHQGVESSANECKAALARIEMISRREDGKPEQAIRDIEAMLERLRATARRQAARRPEQERQQGEEE